MQWLVVAHGGQLIADRAQVRHRCQEICSNRLMLLIEMIAAGCGGGGTHHLMVARMKAMCLEMLLSVMLIAQ